MIVFCKSLFNIGMSLFRYGDVFFEVVAEMVVSVLSSRVVAVRFGGCLLFVV